MLVRRAGGTLVAWIAALALVPSASTAAPSGHEWNTDPRSPIGPAHWQDTWRQCAPGGQQSPIRISPDAAKPDPALNPLMSRFQASRVSVVNTGHAAEVPAPRGGVTLIDGKPYRLSQVHFHAPSEHVIDGKRAALEAHFVHVGAAGKIAVIGVRYDTNDGTQNRTVNRILSRVPMNAGHKANLGSLDPSQLLDGLTGVRNTSSGQEITGFYRYTGSLTTPNCAGGVKWTVLQGVGGVSARAVNRYRTVISRFPHWDGYRGNSRPVQEINGRTITVLPAAS